MNAKLRLNFTLLLLRKCFKIMRASERLFMINLIAKEVF